MPRWPDSLSVSIRRSRGHRPRAWGFVDYVDAHLDAFSFLLRLWIEEDASDGRPLRWRGHITNVLDGRRRSVQSFDQVERFIAEYIIPNRRDLPGEDLS